MRSLCYGIVTFCCNTQARDASRGYRCRVTTSSLTATASPVLASPLVSTQWLCDHLGSDVLIVLDATVLSIAGFDAKPTWLSGLDAYLIDGHIPGALFADLLESFSDADKPYGFARPSAAQFAAAATALGITNSTTVVVYDNALGQWAARLWWLFRAFGYDRVAVLDGGLTKWNLDERPVETGYVEPAHSDGPFVASERPDLWVDKAYVESVVEGRTDARLVCALPTAEFAGTAGPRSRLGHIPGSVNVTAGRLADRTSHVLLRGEALRDAFDAVVDETLPERRIVLYCGAGIAAAADALALVLLGETNVAVYDGSLNEWVADPSAPVVSVGSAAAPSL
ncbi:MAG: Thiosulfate/3-mercaptopyruvate sulfurtransferase [Subtercola sp.]|nr:Thiosulfate/3-mercaptopyruvate sulfurtransferase [Subtercola sp.]